MRKKLLGGGVRGGVVGFGQEQHRKRVCCGAQQAAHAHTGRVEDCVCCTGSDSLKKQD